MWRDHAGVHNWHLLFGQTRGSAPTCGEIEFAVVLTVGWQLVVFQVGQYLPELEEEALAGLVAVGIHVIFS